jgi:ABC-type multidrug transport system fused ATPase/permease subunit
MKTGLYVFDLRNIFELPDIIDKTHSHIPVSQTPPKIEFRNVSFSYPKSGEKVLDNLSFIIEPGKRVALIGENGAGKTTIIKLLARFYDVSGRGYTDQWREYSGNRSQELLSSLVSTYFRTLHATGSR